ncbi:MAG: ABC transporter ATP-binding protein [Balneola sp.]|nr:MAG: ABC transporter ATP-binding protein [Balneola sp.]
MISVQRVSKNYSSKQVLDQITLEIKSAKVVSLIGPSGCGKSTLLRIIMALIKQDTGNVFIDDEEITSQNSLEIRRKIGYVIQKGGLFPHLTARENCAITAKFLGWDSKRIDSRIQELADLVKIDHEIIDRLPSKLSGGQQQRISLIRALMLDPNILLLDEPLGSIDPMVRYELQTDLKEIFTSLGKTVLLVTHDLNEAAYLGDDIVLMNKGKIIQRGTIDNLIEHPADSFVQKFVNSQRSIRVG